MKILFVVNEPWFFLSHRLPIAKAVLELGYEVHVATLDGTAVEEIRSHGFRHHILPVSRGRKRFFEDFRLLLSMFSLFNRVKPDIVHLVTIKPVIYGCIAARFMNISAIVAAVSGLGLVFTASGFRASLTRFLVRHLYKVAFGANNLRVIFQNPNDRELLLRYGAVKPEKVVMIRGSGVNLSTYRVSPEPNGLSIVTLAARFLREKGIHEFVDAARILLADGVKAQFWLVGDIDLGNPNSITIQQLDEWKEEGCVKILGFRKDIADIFSASNLVVLPSYYGEGLPKVLVEAAACGRAVITTDHSGCKDAIEPGKSGLLVPTRDTEALASAIHELLKDDLLREKMGKAGRRLAEQEFGIERIVEQHLGIYQELMANI